MDPRRMSHEAADPAKDDRERDRLVAALRLKLSELDARVVAYRRDRADEFRRFAVDLLAPLSEDTTQAIEAALEGSGKSTATAYPALYPGFLEDGALNRTSILTAPPARLPRWNTSPPPVLYHTSGTPKEGPHRPSSTSSLPGPVASPSLHARDDDFRGVFTPTFLPLLDSWSYSAASTPTVAEKADDRATTDKSAEPPTGAASATTAVTIEPAVERAPGKAPEKTPQSVEVPPREPKLKSALRRTSSISSSRSSTRSSTPVSTNRPPSTPTRHVRFSFNGEEVLPTVSPPRQLEEEQDLSWLMHDGGHSHGAAGHSVYDYSRRYQTVVAHAGPNPHEPALPAEAALSSPVLPGKADVTASPTSADSLSLHRLREDDGKPGTASHFILDNDDTDDSHDGDDIDNINDNDSDLFAPLARKVSSSDRLRALSKMPLEDPANWTVVNPNADTNVDTSVVTSTPPLTAEDLVYQPPPPAATAVPPIPSTIEQRESTEEVKHAEIVEPEPSGGGNPGNSDSDSDDDGFVMGPARKKAAPPVATATVMNGYAERPEHGASPEPVQFAATSASAQAKAKAKATATETEKMKDMTENGSARMRVPINDDDDGFFDFEHDDLDEVADNVMGYPLERVSKSNMLDDAGVHASRNEDAGEEVDAVHDEDPVADAALIQKEKNALGIGTDGLDAPDLVFNRHGVGNKTESHGEDLSTSLLSRLRATQAENLGDNNPELLSGQPDEPSSSSPPPISAGSYRGKPIDLFNVVKDPRILHQAAQMGALHTFVGSIHDRDMETHVPASIAEFSSLSGREQLNLLSGTPRSLTERMIMEDTRKIFSPPR